MKNVLFATLALASVAVFAQSNASGFDGFVSAGLGTNKLSGGELSDSSSMSNMRGTFAYTDASGFGVQLDNVIDKQSLSLGSPSVKIQTNDLALHGFYRRDNYLLGLIHQTRTFKADQVMGGSSMTTLPLDRTFTGFEGQYDFGNVTLYGVSARDKIAAGGEQSIRGRTNLIEARYFLNDNLRGDLSFAQSKFNDLGGELSSTTKTTSLGLEYKFSASPFSAFAKYQNMNGSFLDTKRFIVGVTLNFGKESLKARNSSGASLNPIGVDNQLMSFFSQPQ